MPKRASVSTRIEDIQIEDFDLSLAGLRIIKPEDVIQVHDSMWLHGQLQPIVAREHEGRYQVIDGFKRVYSSMELMLSTLQCQVLYIDLQQAKLLILSYNRPGQKMEAWEEGMILKDLLENHDVTQKQLSNLTGCSRSWVSRRLSLISKIDEEVSSLIRMGTLTTSHARVLMRLPRGNQIDMARVMTRLGLSTRQSDSLIDAYLSAEDADQQQDILADPNLVLYGQMDYLADLYDRDYDHDERLSAYGNNLMRSLENFLRPVRSLLTELGASGINRLKESEQVIINPVLKKASNYTERLSRTIHQLHTNQ